MDPPNQKEVRNAIERVIATDELILPGPERTMLAPAREQRMAHHR